MNSPPLLCESSTSPRPTEVRINNNPHLIEPLRDRTPTSRKHGNRPAPRLRIWSFSFDVGRNSPSLEVPYADPLFCPLHGVDTTAYSIEFGAIGEGTAGLVVAPRVADRLMTGVLNQDGFGVGAGDRTAGGCVGADLIEVLVVDAFKNVC